MKRYARLLEQIDLHPSASQSPLAERTASCHAAATARANLGNVLANLFRPLEIGPVSLHCRIVSTAHQTTLARDHVVTPELLAYQEARARGGVGLIIMEAAATEPAGLLSEEMMAGYLPRRSTAIGR